LLTFSTTNRDEQEKKQRQRKEKKIIKKDISTRFVVASALKSTFALRSQPDINKKLPFERNK